MAHFEMYQKADKYENWDKYCLIQKENKYNWALKDTVHGKRTRSKRTNGTGKGKQSRSCCCVNMLVQSFFCKERVLCTNCTCLMYKLYCELFSLFIKIKNKVFVPCVITWTYINCYITIFTVKTCILPLGHSLYYVRIWYSQMVQSNCLVTAYVTVFPKQTQLISPCGD